MRHCTTRGAAVVQCLMAMRNELAKRKLRAAMAYETSPEPVGRICAEHGISRGTLYRWLAELGIAAHGKRRGRNTGGRAGLNPRRPHQ